MNFQQESTNIEWSPQANLLINCAVVQNNTTREEEEKQFITAQCLESASVMSYDRIYELARLNLPRVLNLSSPIDLTRYTRETLPGFLGGAS